MKIIKIKKIFQYLEEALEYLGFALMVQLERFTEDEDKERANIALDLKKLLTGAIANTCIIVMLYMVIRVVSWLIILIGK